MRQELKINTTARTVLLIGLSGLSLQACSFASRTAMDYLPDAALTLIEKDIQNGHQADDEAKEPISVQSMLASILGTDPKETEDEAVISEAKLDLDPITTLELEELHVAAPLPKRKPLITVNTEPSLEELKEIEMVLNDETPSKIRQEISSLTGDNNFAVVSVGPIGEADNIQMASLQAMAKASAIGEELKNDFKNIKIKFNPLQPRGTVKVTIEGKKSDA